MSGTQTDVAPPTRRAGDHAPPPGGKTAEDENFPVASRFLPRETRSAVVHFYRFARAADDIADSPDLGAQEKLSLLSMLDELLAGRAPAAVPDHPAVEPAIRLREDLSRREVPVDHARHLLQAFMMDATKTRYDTWSDLLLYCNFSAAPVGRFLLDLHGEDRSAKPASDALCNAHQILNHVQDCKADYLRLDRVYLPQRWLQQAGTGVEALRDDRTSPALRGVLDRALDGVEGLMTCARPLARGLRSRGLRIQAEATIAMADEMLRLLRRGDPLARHLELSTARKLWCATRGVTRGWRSPA